MSAETKANVELVRVARHAFNENDLDACVERPAGRRVRYVSYEFYRVANGLIAEEWICSDTASLFRQIG